VCVCVLSIQVILCIFSGYVVEIFVLVYVNYIYLFDMACEIEVLAVMALKTFVFWYKTLCCLVSSA